KYNVKLRINYYIQNNINEITLKQDLLYPNAVLPKNIFITKMFLIRPTVDLLVKRISEIKNNMYKIYNNNINTQYHENLKELYSDLAAAIFEYYLFWIKLK